MDESKPFTFRTTGGSVVHGDTGSLTPETPPRTPVNPVVLLIRVVLPLAVLAGVYFGLTGALTGLAAVFVLALVRRWWNRPTTVRADRSGLTTDQGLLPWSGVVRIEDDLVRWSDTTNEQNPVEHFAHAVVLVSPGEKRALWVTSASEAESIAARLRFFAAGDGGSRTDIPERLRAAQAIAEGV